jgi:hypothetical protein
MNNDSKHKNGFDLEYPGVLKRIHSDDPPSNHGPSAQFISLNQSLSNTNHLSTLNPEFKATDSTSVQSYINNEDFPSKNVKQGAVYQDLVQKYIKDPTSFIDNYKVLKYRDIKYYINADLLVRNEADVNNDFICKLIRIIRPNKLENNKILAFLEVQW